MKKRVAIQTLGCKANQADTAFLAAEIAGRNYQLVSPDDVADIYIVNSCTVTDDADRTARRLTRRAKRRNPGAQVVLTGCYAQTQPEEAAQLDSVDLLVGNANKSTLPELLPVLNRRTARTSAVPNILKQDTVHSFGHSHFGRNSRAQVKIQDGCSKFCTFCIIPFARGKNRSVPLEQIIAELHRLRRAGFEEAVLTGIHIGTYGRDRGSNLLELLQHIRAEQPLPRIRLSSLDPEEVTPELIDLVAADEIFCPHFHIAVQSGDNDILDRMKRRYRIDRFYQVVDWISTKLPEAALGTDIIVGFPGESDTSFESTYQMVAELPIHYVHAFPYSPRRNTPAASFGEQIPTQMRRERNQRLGALARKKKQRYFSQFIDRSLDVIVEGKRDPKEGLLRGMTRNYIPVCFNGSDALLRQRLMVTLNRQRKERVYGEVYPI